MRNFTVTVTYRVEANDHAQATSVVQDAATEYNKAAINASPRRPQRINVDEVVKVKEIS